MMNLLNEFGVAYTHKAEAGLTECRYRWLHIPSGKVGESVVWVAGGVLGFVKLLAGWNNGAYWYAPVTTPEWYMRPRAYYPRMT